MSGHILRSGDAWRSDVIDHAFVIKGGLETWPGLGEWSREKFTGYRAERKGDNRIALVALMCKPENYRYDYVLYD